MSWSPQFRANIPFRLVSLSNSQNNVGVPVSQSSVLKCAANVFSAFSPQCSGNQTDLHRCALTLPTSSFSNAPVPLVCTLTVSSSNLTPQKFILNSMLNTSYQQMKKNNNGLLLIIIQNHIPLQIVTIPDTGRR